ncbi:exodeoxyribonuclease V subunit beta [Paucibacter sp. KBW04]|uniref:exodeoxyribonuclease V subunit beta n=1 Tax=Paucibacter sp. KBW04 TaxID=2153361 RepID=UPI000F5725F3|nr:exodeoxyribonuclease V subunit beta [Paucibacter sp. KBW04]RQO62541.1 exodeoxyribonuclease V subunit beta [Paucibacter sp. KBW04]
MTNALHPLSFPLWGSRLIEASAGTGKTWTIAALYLRLVLGHGEAADAAEPTAFQRPLLPAEILVMTFTRAATRELSDRIRSRLLEAARCFRGEGEETEYDEFLRDLLQAYPAGAVRERAAWTLALAAESMDDAAVHTIDAWCQRMLREHAFDSGCLFDEELQGNEGELQVLAAQDYWRSELYPLRAADLEQALSVWPHVDALAKDARGLLDFAMPEGAGEGSLGALIEEVSLQRATALGDLKQGWEARAAEMQRWLDELYALKNCPFDKRSLNQKHYSNWLSALAAWAREDSSATDAATYPDMKTGLTRFTPEGMEKAWKPDAAFDLPEHFAAFEQLMQALQALPDLAALARLHATARIQQRLAELKLKAGTFGFADMLTRLDRALDPELNGPAAERLRQRMLAQYPVALIDEFQDTSPLQLRIFDRLYRIAEHRSDKALLLIGDPKQSIYGFRGADIYSYLQARRATEGRHYVLGTNHRSTQALVKAVNHVFERAEQRVGEGAFMFRRPDENPLPFEAVAAKGRKQQFVCSDGPQPALSLALDAELRDGGSSQRLFAAHCAQRIVDLLNDAQAGFQDSETQAFTRLRPADIAVLVRTGREAAAVRRELRRRAVASVYLSDKDSVFMSVEAGDLLRWLKAVAQPLDSRLVRAALATRMLSLSLAELSVLAADDEVFDRRSEDLKALRQVWRAQGVLAMLRQTLHLLDLPARWLASSGEAGGLLGLETNGERRLTNFLHLAEMLQSASRQLEGEQALIRWLAGQIESAGLRGGEEQVLRLESDADLVKVVTVHKSKGLEYPLVFLPFACAFRGVDGRSSYVKVADEQGEARLHLQLTPELIEAADRERQREDLRLLYVALTRARHSLWLGIAAISLRGGKDSTAHRSALGYLLAGPHKMSGEGLAEQVNLLAQDQAEMQVLAMPGQPALPGRLLPREAPPPLRELQPYEAEFERRWTIGSFSALVRALPHTGGGATAVTVAAAREDESEQAATSPETVQAEPAQSEAAPAPWHSFPRGALAGNFLHDQLEWLMSEKAAQGGTLSDSPELRAQLTRRCERGLWAGHAEAVLAWLSQVCATVIPGVGASLDQIQRPLPEMEFWFPSEGLLASHLDQLCRQHLLDGHARPALPQRELRGMLMGFADLVFEQGGRFYVLDYKSNALGDADADYQLTNLEAAMAQHRYEVQAAIYLLALHRLLRARLGEAYEPGEHLGGAVFFFLRGIGHPGRGCYTVEPPLALLEKLDALFREDVLLSQEQAA